MVQFRNFRPEDYDALCLFLKERNRNTPARIHWNWARFEWMYAHPEFDAACISSIGLWWDGSRVAAAAVYDMYFGEAYCDTLPEYAALYPQVLHYAWQQLRDDAGLGIALPDTDTEAIRTAQEMGFAPAEQEETILAIPLDNRLDFCLPEGLRLENLDPAREPERFQWLLWQGFDHGTDRAEFAREETIAVQHRPHLIPSLSVAAVAPDGTDAGYCCVWYDADTDYAYVEPVCVVPAWRGGGVGRAVVCEALNRAAALGAKQAYVISNQPFYVHLGFRMQQHYTFYWKK